MHDAEVMISLLTQWVSIFCVVIGALAFVVSVIVQTIKELPYLKDIPTACVVLVLSILLSLVSLEAYLSYFKDARMWYYYVGAIILGFFIALVTTSGWDKLKELVTHTKWGGA